MLAVTSGAFKDGLLAVCSTAVHTARNALLWTTYGLSQLIAPPPPKVKFTTIELARSKHIPMMKVCFSYPFLLAWKPLLTRGVGLLRCQPYSSGGRTYMRIERLIPAQGPHTDRVATFPPLLLGMIKVNETERDVTDALSALLGPKRDLGGVTLTVRELYYVLKEMIGLPAGPSETVSLAVLTQPDFQHLTYSASEVFAYPKPRGGHVMVSGDEMGPVAVNSMLPSAESTASTNH